jgi:hypothetical protein
MAAYAAPVLSGNQRTWLLRRRRCSAWSSEASGVGGRRRCDVHDVRSPLFEGDGVKAVLCIAATSAIPGTRIASGNEGGRTDTTARKRISKHKQFNAGRFRGRGRDGRRITFATKTPAKNAMRGGMCRRASFHCADAVTQSTCIRSIGPWRIAAARRADAGASPAQLAGSKRAAPRSRGTDRTEIGCHFCHSFSPQVEGSEL